MLKSPVADFRSFQSGHTVYDGGATYILIQSEYVLSTGDINVLKDSLNTVMKSIEFYRKRFNDGLIKEGYLCEWADAVLKKGYVLYTNIVYLSGIKRFIEILKKYRGVVDVDVINDYEKYYEKLKIQLYTNLWNGKYFSDYNDGKRRDYLAVHPNMLAILFDITTKEENMSIIKEVEKNCLLDLGMRSNYPKYPIHLIPIHNYLAGVPDYHNGIYWLQPWVLYISVLLKLKRREDAIIQLNRLNEIIIRDNCVYENYDYDFKPTNRLFYKSEGPFAWNSGLILWMLKQLNGI